MTRPLRRGWLVALFAVITSISAWLPWLTTSVNGGGWASAIGGSAGLVLPKGFGAGQLLVLLSSALLVAGAMVGRGLSVRAASLAAVLISLLIVLIAAWYYSLNVTPPVSAAYGLYIGVGSALGALGCSVWAVGSALASTRGRVST